MQHAAKPRGSCWNAFTLYQHKYRVRLPRACATCTATNTAAHPQGNTLPKDTSPRQRSPRVAGSSPSWRFLPARNAEPQISERVPTRSLPSPPAKPRNKMLDRVAHIALTQSVVARTQIKPSRLQHTKIKLPGRRDQYACLGYGATNDEREEVETTPPPETRALNNYREVLLKYHTAI